MPLDRLVLLLASQVSGAKIFFALLRRYDADLRVISTKLATVVNDRVNV